MRGIRARSWYRAAELVASERGGVFRKLVECNRAAQSTLTSRASPALMDYQSSKDEAFVARVSELLRSRGEALGLFRYARAAGSKDFLFLNDINVFRSKLETLPVDTNVVVFGDRPLPLRGKVDSEFIGRALEFIPEGAEYLVLCLERTIHDYRPHHYWESFDDSAGETHAELIEDLNEYCGRVVAVGLWPPWPEQSSTSFEAYVPDALGMIRPGPY